MVPGSPPEDEFDRAFLNGLLGSLLALGGALVLAALPPGDDIRGSGFYKVGKLTLANFIDSAGSVAGPLAILATLLLLATAALWLSGRRDELTAVVCVIQPIIGTLALAGSVIPWAALLGMIALHLLAYAIITAIVIGCVFGGLTGGSE